MKLTEDRLARELEKEASRVRVDTAPIWFGTMRRAEDARSAGPRPRRHSVGIAIAAGAGVLAVGVAVPVAAHMLQSAEQQQLDGTVPQPDTPPNPAPVPRPDGGPAPVPPPEPGPTPVPPPDPVPEPPDPVPEPPVPGPTTDGRNR